MPKIRIFPIPIRIFGAAQNRRLPGIAIHLHIR
jgi:hypothetical protein